MDTVSSAAHTAKPGRLRFSSFSEDCCEAFPPCCPVCGSEDACPDPDACSLALDGLNGAPPNNPEFDAPVSFEPDGLPF